MRSSILIVLATTASFVLGSPFNLGPTTSIPQCSDSSGNTVDCTCSCDDGYTLTYDEWDYVCRSENGGEYGSVGGVHRDSLIGNPVEQQPSCVTVS